jgi:ATP-dependent Clp protease ATP-binding subunit ClpA
MFTQLILFQFQCIGATTLDEYRKHVEKDPALERRFQPVKVPEPSVDETIEILRGLRERYEIHHKLRYTDDSLIAAAKLSYQYIRYVIYMVSMVFQDFKKCQRKLLFFCLDLMYISCIL